MTVAAARERDILARPVIGWSETSPIVDRLEAIYHRARQIEAERPTSEDPISATPFEWRPPATIPSRLASVTDVESGLRHAVWCIGETIMALGGAELAHAIFAAFEDRLPDDPRAGPWLDHRWNGIEVCGAIWVS